MSSGLGKIWVFDESKLDEALANYRHASLEAYPAQQEKIDITLLAIKDFLDSEYADKLKMNIKLSDKSQAME
jgi:hypothetical protein